MTELSWLVGALIALASGLWLVIGMRLENRNLGKTVQTADRARLNARAYKDQLQLLQLRLEQAEIDPEQFEEAREQLEQTLLGELEDEANSWRNQAWTLRGKLSLAVLVVGLALGSFLISRGQQHFDPAQIVKNEPSVEEMVSSLAAKLEREPDNLQGWVMLGRSYSVMRRYADAAKAYQQANRLSDFSEPELLVAEAESLGLAAGQNLSGEPLRLIKKALSLDENNVRALWYGLLAATQNGDAEEKQNYLARLEAQPELPEQLADLLRTEFSAQLKMDQTDDSIDAAGPVLQLEIDVPEEMRAQLPEGATLFVFAKAQQGPPMPLAVSRQSLPQRWPVSVRLDDSMGMMENMSLSSFPAWTVVARISRSGMAKAQSGDWEASLNIDAAQTGARHSLSIRQILP